MVEIENKVVLITGGIGGIGYETAKELLRNNAKGVALLDINVDGGKLLIDDLQNEFGKEKSIFIETNVSSSKSLENAFEEVVRFFKQLDIVINNAAVIKETDWKSCVDVNIKGVIEGTKLALEIYLPKYKSKEEPVIVNVASVAALDQHGGVLPVYTSTKYGILGFSRCVAANYETNRIRILTVCPGFTETNIIANAVKEIPTAFKTQTNERPKSQKPSYVGQSIVKMIKNADNGKVWLFEDYEAYEIEFPSIADMKILIDD